MNLLLVLIIIYLAFCSYADIKNKTIPLIPTIIISILTIVIQIINTMFYDTKLLSLIISFIPGLIMILLSVITKECIGYGDSIILALCSICIGALDGVFLIMCSFIYSAIFSLFLLIKGKKKHDTIPFIPFIFLSLIGYILIN